MGKPWGSESSVMQREISFSSSERAALSGAAGNTRAASSGTRRVKGGALSKAKGSALETPPFALPYRPCANHPFEGWFMICEKRLAHFSLRHLDMRFGYIYIRHP